MPRLVLASKNKGKLREIQELLASTGWNVVLMDDYPHVIPAEEDGETFRDNAVKKAVTVAQATGEWTLADDSGLQVDALGGAPGVHSARYAGEHGDDNANNQRLLRELNQIPEEERTARFYCAMALVAPDESKWTIDGVCEGHIGFEPRGDGGFGYDPLFVLSSGKTMAEISELEKNQISHRAKAMEKMKKILYEAAKVSTEA
jgi:XTP/dITP diphosphohydrolase